MSEEELVERMARAVFVVDGNVHTDTERMLQPVKWEELDDDDYQCIRGGYRDKATAALTALREAIPGLDALIAGAGAADVLAERARQQSAEGWTPEHDDRHHRQQLARAAACYALWSDAYPNPGQPPSAWPWAPEWWKPKDYRRDLVRAAALIIAEIERLDRAMIEAAKG